MTVPADAPASIERVAEIVRSHPRGVASRHVLHNLGEARIAWLEKEVPTWSSSTRS